MKPGDLTLSRRSLQTLATMTRPRFDPWPAWTNLHDTYRFTVPREAPQWWVDLFTSYAQVEATETIARMLEEGQSWDAIDSLARLQPHAVAVLKVFATNEHAFLAGTEGPAYDDPDRAPLVLRTPKPPPSSSR